MLRLLVKLGNWASNRLALRAEKEMLRKFPVGTRVELTGGCGCSRSLAGQAGTVLGLCSMQTDYSVSVDGQKWADGKPRAYDLFCAKSLKRLGEVG